MKLKHHYKKAIAVSCLLLVLAGTAIFTPGARSRTRSYFSGDAIVYDGQLIIGSANMGGIELFRLEGEHLARVSTIHGEAQFAGTNDFTNLHFSQEAGRLYVYAVDGRHLYQYDITDLSRITLVNKIKDNAFDWFNGVTKAGGRLVTIGTNGIKFYNKQLQNVSDHKIYNRLPRNIAFNDNAELIFNIDNASLTIYDTKVRQVIAQAGLEVREGHDRKPFVDDNGSVYAVDDYSFKRFDYNGNLQSSFKHISTLGYDVDGLPGREYLFFSDGVGVVKIDKATMEPLDWTFTKSLGEPGGWAIGLKAVEDNGGEKLVVFNNSSLMVLDDQLDLIDFFKSNTPELRPIEALSLRADKIRAPGNADISLRGTGFGINEDLEVRFANSKTMLQADENGRFTAILTVPQVLPTRTDIRVTGKTTGLTYSLAFQIE